MGMSPSLCVIHMACHLLYGHICMLVKSSLTMTATIHPSLWWFSLSFLPYMQQQHSSRQVQLSSATHVRPTCPNHYDDHFFSYLVPTGFPIITRQCDSVERMTRKVNGKCHISGSASTETLGSIFKNLITSGALPHSKYCDQSGSKGACLHV